MTEHLSGWQVFQEIEIELRIITSQSFARNGVAHNSVASTVDQRA